MSELLPKAEATAPRPARTLPSKRVLIVAAAGVILFAVIFGLISWQQSAKFEADILRIEKLIEDEDFAAAENAITVAQLNNVDNQDLRRLEDKVLNLRISKSSYTEGAQFLLKKDYQSALTILKKVIKTDVNRYNEAQTKINEAQEAYSLAVLSEAKSLATRKKFNDALTLVSRAASFITLSADLVKLRQELSPLALAETTRAEEAQLAVYRNALNKMRVETDKFSGAKFYTDRSTPVYANYSTFHIYIGKSAGGNPYLRFKVRYSDDDWLFVESASINVDGDIRDLDVGSDWDRDNGSGDIWEWVDVTATESHLSLVRDVINSKSAVIRYFGSKYRDDRTITSAQKSALQNVLNAYEALKRL